MYLFAELERFNFVIWLEEIFELHLFFAFVQKGQNQATIFLSILDVTLVESLKLLCINKDLPGTSVKVVCKVNAKNLLALSGANENRNFDTTFWIILILIYYK